MAPIHPTGPGFNGITAGGGNGGMPPSVPDVWPVILAHLSADTQPTIDNLRRLRSALWAEDRNPERSTSISRLLNETSDAPPLTVNIERAWQELRNWMVELDIDTDELRGRISRQGEMAVARKAADATLTENAAAPAKDTGGGLNRSAARFADGVIDKERIYAYQRETFQISGEIRAQISRWQERYGDRSEAPKEDIERRLGSTEKEWPLVENDADYARDILDRTRILWNRVVRTERDLFTETAPASTFRVNLHEREAATRPDRAERGTPPAPATVTRRPPPVERKEGEHIPALVNEKRGDFEISLRSYQWGVLGAIQTDWGLHEKNNRPWPVQDNAVVAPTGSGKTRVMAAGIELGMREGWLDFGNGAKAVILTHLRQISTQNVGAMKELLNPAFRQLYGRDVNVTAIGEGAWDAGGDVVITSVPTIGRRGNEEKLRNSFSNVRKALVLKDEYHHAGAVSWRRASEALRRVVGRGYTLGFTATLPPAERPATNVVAELSTTDLMQKGALPPVELVQVNTGVDLQRIPTIAGEFSPDAVSRSVRNPERYEHMMRALEFNGVRAEGGGLAPTLIFGIDIAHINELARYYQLYFSKGRDTYQTISLTGEPVSIRALGTRNIAVIDDSTPEEEVRRMLDDYKADRRSTITRFDYRRSGSGTALLAIGDHEVERIDGIVAVITGDTPPARREKIIEASRKGDVECIVNAKVFAEGFDAPWIQNLVGAKPALGWLQKAQEVGRILRYMIREVSEDGRILARVRRVLIDLVDVRSGIKTYYDALGVEGGRELERSTGVRIDVANGKAVGTAYGGLKDVWDIDGDGYEKRVLAEISEDQLIRVTGEREHYLLPIEHAGALGQRLRDVFRQGYRGDLAGMAFDLAVTEEMLVGYLNGSLPEDGSIARRVATFLYAERDSLSRAYTESRLSWVPLEEIPEDMRELVKLAREKAMELFGGKLPSNGFTTVDGSFSGQLYNSPLHTFLRSGRIKYSTKNTPTQFWQKVDRVFFVERQNDGIHYIGMDEDSKKLKDRLISKLEVWAPLEEISEERRELVEIARRHVIDAFGGRLPNPGFTTVDGSFSGQLRGKSLRDFLRSGKIKYTPNNTPTQFWQKVDRAFFAERRGSEIHYVGMDEETKKLKDRLISKLEGWVSLEEISEDRRELVKVVRRHVIDALDGRLLGDGFTTVDGSFSGHLKGSPLHDFLRSGKIEYCNSNTPTQFWQKVDRVFFVERQNDGIHYIGMDEDSKKLKDRLISKLEVWAPLEEISEERRELVKAVRRHVIEAFGGRLPTRFTTVGGSFSGQLSESPLHDFLSSGKIKYGNSNTPTQFWQKVEKLLFVEQIDGGGYRHVTPDPRTAELLADLRSKGGTAWRATGGRGKKNSHPLSAPLQPGRSPTGAEVKDKGFATVELLAWPVIGPADLAIKAYRAIPKPAQTTLRGGFIFLLGDIGSELVRGNWDYFRKLSVGAVAADYAALSVGGGIGNLTVKQLFSNPAIARVTPNILKGIAGRAIPLFSALAVLERAKNGKIDWGQLPVGMGNVLTASTAVQGAVTLFGKSQGFRRAGEALRVVTTAGKATLIGAVAMSVAEFTIIKLMGDVENWVTEKWRMSAIKGGLAEAIIRHQNLLGEIRNGGDVNIEEMMKVEGELTAYIKIFDAEVHAREEEAEKGFDAEGEYVENLYQKRKTGTTNCHPSQAPEWVLEKRRSARLAGIEDEEDKALVEMKKERDKMVSFYPLPADLDDVPLFALPDGKELLWDTDKKEFYNLRMAKNLPSLHAQLARYIDDTNKELAAYLEHHAKELAMTF